MSKLFIYIVASALLIAKVLAPTNISVAQAPSPVIMVVEKEKNVALKSVSPETILDKAERKAYLLAVKEVVAKSFPDAPIMVQIASAESSFNPLNKNRSGSTAKGLFQILDGTWKGEKCVGEVYNIYDNIECAKKLKKRYGTTPWVSSADSWRVKTTEAITPVVVYPQPLELIPENGDIIEELKVININNE